MITSKSKYENTLSAVTAVIKSQIIHKTRSFMTGAKVTGDVHCLGKVEIMIACAVMGFF